ncbi:MAG: serine/threonine-protein kinase [Polyangiaceae bacterium]
MSQLLGRGEIIDGRYAVRRELGRGGMAAVYLCRDRVVGDECALKVLFVEGDPEGHQAQSHMVWFQQEARALAALDHPAIVRARDFGTLPNGAPFLVMDKLDGRSLFRWMQMGPMPWPVTWTLMDQVLAGLAHAHARRIIHGDLKPSNIMLDARGGLEAPRAFILDLGLAWLLADHIDPRLRVEAPDALALPIGGGTPGWLAPEQIRQATPHIGPATDLYALGCILWELLTGREVFDGTPDEILDIIDEAPVPMPKLLTGVPKKAGDFVVQLLAKRPWHRFRYAADARAAWWCVELAPAGQSGRDPPRSASEPPPFDVPIPALKSRARGPAEIILAPGILALRGHARWWVEGERRCFSKRSQTSVQVGGAIIVSWCSRATRVARAVWPVAM